MCDSTCYNNRDLVDDLKQQLADMAELCRQQQATIALQSAENKLLRSKLDVAMSAEYRTRGLTNPLMERNGLIEKE